MEQRQTDLLYQGGGIIQIFDELLVVQWSGEPFLIIRKFVQFSGRALRTLSAPHQFVYTPRPRPLPFLAPGPYKMVVYVPRKLCLAGEQTLPPSIPLIIHRSEEWAMKENCVYNCKSSEDEVEKQVTDSDEVQQTAAKSHKKGPLKVVPEALELLSQIQKPIAVLSIFGPYRSGKSYLLSQVLGCPDAFRVGHTMEPCTRGIWMATTILECEEFAVIFLDTEGADSVSFNDDDDVVTDRTDFIKKQLILTTLLSSVLVYNSLTVPEWSDLEDLRYII